MKKIFIPFIVCSMVLFLPLFTLAEEYAKNVLIPIDTVATVNTGKFQYQDFVYSSQIDENGNSLISFGSIHNNTISKSSVSVNMLLFDSDKKNIGFLTYCSAKDISSNYAGFKLSGNQSHDFSILVTPKYFVNGKSTKDVSYIAVMDENKYCQIGGYDNYQGLTIEEITKVDNPIKKGNNFFQKFIQKLASNIFTSNLIIIFSVLILFVALGVILNKLHMKMYGYKNILAYFPITDSYIAAKSVFGEIVGIVYFILYVISLLFLIAKISMFAYITNFMLLILILLVIVKLVTRNYNLFYLQSSMNLLGHNSMTENFERREIKNEKSETLDERDTSLLSDNQPTLDLNYNNVDNSMLPENDIPVSSSNDNNTSVNSSSIIDLYSVSENNSNNNTEEPNFSNLLVDTNKINELQQNSSFDSTSDEDLDDDEDTDFDDFF